MSTCASCTLPLSHDFLLCWGKKVKPIYPHNEFLCEHGCRSPFCPYRCSPCSRVHVSPFCPPARRHRPLMQVHASSLSADGNQDSSS